MFITSIIWYGRITVHPPLPLLLTSVGGASPRWWTVLWWCVIQLFPFQRLLNYIFYYLPIETLWSDRFIACALVKLDFIVAGSVTSHSRLQVHCSAGVGRTGTLMALHLQMRMLSDDQRVDLFGIVCRLRRCRKLMVQTSVSSWFSSF